MTRGYRTRLVGTAFLLVSMATADGPLQADEYEQRVVPFTKKYCVQCHSGKKARGELDLSRYPRAADVTRDFRRWGNVLEFIRKGEMPPAESKQPAPDDRKTVVYALEAMFAAEARKHAGDPGAVLPRRLSNTEYDLSIRDLTGVDIRPTKEFPVDPAAGEGFDNTGEALMMSPSLLRKYLSAAQHVSEHLVLKPAGITFAPFPVTSYNERKKLVEQAIIDFYESHEVRTLDYLVAAWRYRHRAADERQLSLEAWAKRQGLSGKYLALVWKTLNEASAGTGYLQKLAEHWKAIPAPSGKVVPRELVALDRFIDRCRSQLGHREEALIRSNAGNWPISHLDFRAKTAAQRDRFDVGNLRSKHLIQFERVRAEQE